MSLEPGEQERASGQVRRYAIERSDAFEGSDAAATGERACMVPMADDLTFFHDAPNDRFVLDDAEGELGYISYAYADGVFDLRHTVVRPAARGRGVGLRLARATFEWIRDDGSRLVPTCSFLPEALRQYPEFDDLVAA